MLGEPLEGLDVKTQFTLKEILSDWTRNNQTVIYSSHLMEVVEKLCQSLAIIHEGEIVATGSPEEVMQSTQ